MSATSVPLRIGQVLKGKQASYTITQQLFSTVWLASSPSSPKPLIVKSVGSWLLSNERSILARFQNRAPSLRRLVDEINHTNGPSSTPAIVLQYLDTDLLKVGLAGQKLSRQNVKLVAKKVLDALAVLHEDGYVHTDVKPDNILVNWDTKDPSGTTIEEACLSDCGTTVTKTSRFAKKGDLIGGALWRSPEATLGMRWSTSTDIWSFGATLITLLAGNNFFLFKPVQTDSASTPTHLHPEYTARILENHVRFFGPRPRPIPGFSSATTTTSSSSSSLPTTSEGMSGVATNEITAALESTIAKISSDEPGFADHPVLKAQLSTSDMLFINKIMKLNPSERPTAKQLLNDEWFNI